jgi:hypothetical protein
VFGIDNNNNNNCCHHWLLSNDTGSRTLSSWKTTQPPLLPLLTWKNCCIKQHWIKDK